MLWALLVAYGVLALLALLWSERLIFQPPPASYGPAPDLLSLTTSDGVALAALYLPNPDGRYTLLYSHGNAEDLGDARPGLEALRDLGFAVFAYDYRGYGRSSGRASEAGVYRDVEAAYQYLTGPLAVLPERIILHGISVGSGPAVELATRRPVAGLILEGAFASAFTVLTRVPLFPFDRFRNLRKLGRVHCPVLVIHGTADEVIPFAHGRKLFAGAQAPKQHLWVRGARHNDLRLVAGERYGRALQEFEATLPAPTSGY
ncbi:MAG: alpha/beta hydrolase [Gemmatimonadetes bacterium]|nr:alpha/beta hydrolase [Gemmatimonadota bacterium]